jgi:hypothetical protein
MSDAISFRGIPRTSEEWAALAKVASGYPNLTKEELRRLFMLGLVDRQLGRICLSAHGRNTLGLGETQFHAGAAATAHPHQARRSDESRNPGPA